MTTATLIETTMLDPARVEVGDRLRPVSAAGLASLRASVAETGVIKDDIIVRAKGGGLILIAGLHRLTLCRELGIEVPAKVYRCSDDWARLVEIDDNAAGSNLTPLDTALFLAERKRIHERMHPETKRGGNVVQAVDRERTDTMSVSSFAAATAETFGLSERHVYRLLAGGESLDAHHVADLRRSPNPVTLKDLQVIGGIHSREHRMLVCRAMGRGEAKNASAAFRSIREASSTRPPPPAPHDLAAESIRARWDAATEEGRRRFVASNPPGLLRLIARELGPGMQAMLDAVAKESR
ncbi:MAG: ParB/RepB/Spo0J family partition protein [Paracoccaceae bacterium]